jgi:hypothetical protein
MTPFGESHRYQEQIGAFLLGKLDAGELKAMQAHLDSCPSCQAEARELEPVVAALADAVPDRIDEVTRPPGDLEESTLAPILGEIQHARSSRRQFQWSAVAAAAIFVVVMGLAAFTWLAGPGVALEKLSFSDVPPDVKVEGDLIAHDWGTEIRLDVSGLQFCQTYRVTLENEDGERVNVGTIIGTGDKTVSRTFKSELSREDASRLEVRTPGGELVSFADLPEEPRVADRGLLSLDGILPWADSPPPNETTGACGPESPEGPSPEEKPPPDKSPPDTFPPDKREKPKADDPGGGTPYKESPPEGDGEKPSPGDDEKPNPEPDRRGPGGDDSPNGPDPCKPPPDERSPDDNQYNPNTGSEC